MNNLLENLCTKFWTCDAVSSTDGTAGRICFTTAFSVALLWTYAVMQILWLPVRWRRHCCGLMTLCRYSGCPSVGAVNFKTLFVPKRTIQLVLISRLSQTFSSPCCILIILRRTYSWYANVLWTVSYFSLCKKFSHLYFSLFELLYHAQPLTTQFSTPMTATKHLLR